MATTQAAGTPVETDRRKIEQIAATRFKPFSAGQAQ